MNITKMKEIAIEQIEQDEAKRKANLHQNREWLIEARAILEEIGITEISEKTETTSDFGILSAVLPDLDEYHKKHASHLDKPHLEVVVQNGHNLYVRGVKATDIFNSKTTNGMKDAIIKHLMPFYKLNEEIKRRL